MVAEVINSSPSTTFLSYFIGSELTSAFAALILFSRDSSVFVVCSVMIFVSFHRSFFLIIIVMFHKEEKEWKGAEGKRCENVKKTVLRHRMGTDALPIRVEIYNDQTLLAHARRATIREEGIVVGVACFIFCEDGIIIPEGTAEIQKKISSLLRKPNPSASPDIRLSLLGYLHSSRF